MNALSHDLLIIGNAINGDAWAIDLRDRRGRVVILSHDSIWEGECDCPREAMWEVAPSLSAAVKLARAKKLPIDSYEARSRSDPL